MGRERIAGSGKPSDRPAPSPVPHRHQGGMALHAACYIGTEAKDKVVTVKIKGLHDTSHCDADILLGHEVIGGAKGDWKTKDFRVAIKGFDVPLTCKGFGTYSAVVPPGLDHALVSLLVMALDDLFRDKAF